MKRSAWPMLSQALAQRLPRSPALTLILCLGLLPAMAAAQESTAVEQARIQRERQAVDTRYRQEQAECAQRFVVNACMDDARSRRREALAPLRQQELILSDRERKQRAAERTRDIERNRIDADARALAPPPIASAVRGRPAKLPASGAASAGTRDKAAAKPSLSAPSAPSAPRGRAAAMPASAVAAQKAAVRASEANQRRAEAQADRERIRARVEKRAAEGKKAAPLPTPEIKP